MTATLPRTTIAIMACSALFAVGCSDGDVPDAAPDASSATEIDDAVAGGTEESAGEAEPADRPADAVAMPSGAPYVPVTAPTVVDVMREPRQTDMAGMVGWLFVDIDDDEEGRRLRARWPFSGEVAWQIDIGGLEGRCEQQLEVDGRQLLLVGPGQLKGEGDGPAGSFGAEGDGELTDAFHYRLYDRGAGELVWSGQFESERSLRCPEEVGISSGMLRVDQLLFRLDRDEDNVVATWEHAGVHGDGQWAVVGDHFVEREVTQHDRSEDSALVLTGQDGDTRTVEMPDSVESFEGAIWPVDDRYVILWSRALSMTDTNPRSVAIVDVAEGELLVTNGGDNVPCCSTPRDVSDMSIGGLVAFDGQYLELATGQFHDAPPGEQVGGWLYRAEQSSDTFRVSFSRGAGSPAVVYEAAGGELPPSVVVTDDDVAIIGSGSYLYALDLDAEDELWTLDVEELMDGWQVRSTSPVAATPAGLVVSAWAETPETEDRLRWWLLLDDR